MLPRRLPPRAHQAGLGLVSAAAMADSSPGVSAAEAAAPVRLEGNGGLHVIFGAGQVGRVLAALLAERGGRRMRPIVMRPAMPPRAPQLSISASTLPTLSGQSGSRPCSAAYWRPLSAPARCW